MRSGTLFFLVFVLYNLEAKSVSLFRYPECDFDADDDEYSCPACERFCNCTVCCRKRGEAYVGTRRCDKYTPPPPSSSKTKIKTRTIPKRATNAWGSLYNIYFIRW